MAVNSTQPDGSSNRVLHGREATVKIKDALTSFTEGEEGDPIFFKDSSGAEQGQYTTGTGESVDFSGILTEITITDPEAGVEVQNTFGGQVMTESPHDLVEIEFTARFQDISMIEQMMDTGVTVSTTDSEDFTRVSGGTEIGNRPNKAILFTVEKSEGRVNYLMNNAIFQQMGEISLAGDGAAEITGTALCRVADRHVEDSF